MRERLGNVEAVGFVDNENISRYLDQMEKDFGGENGRPLKGY